MRRIIVGVKRVVDYNVRIQVKPDGSGVVTDGVKLSANPFDDIALEEALRLRDKGIATEVIVATSARPTPRRTSRNGLAMGANRAIHVRHRRRPIQPLTAARALLKLIEKEAAGPRDPRQAGDRRRRQPDRPDAGHAVGSPAGDVRLEGRSRSGKAPRSRAKSTPAWKRSKSTCPR